MFRTNLKPHFIFNLQSTFLICLIFFFGNAIKSHAEKVNLPARFDFGPAHSLKENFQSVDQSDLYSAEKGYGLLEEADGFYSCPEGKKDRDNLIYDGVIASDKLAFRIDLEPGNYWIEIYMAGGEFNYWMGEINVNGRMIADSLNAYRATFEEDTPPLYWTFLRKVTVEDNFFILEINSKNQPSTISALSVFHADPGPLLQKDGRLEIVGPFESPNADFALRLINEGRVEEAQRIIDPIPEELYGYEKAFLLIGLAGRLETANPRPLLEWASYLLCKVSEDEKKDAAAWNIKLIELFLQADQWYKMAGWDWAKKMTGQGIFDRVDRAGFSLQKITEVHNHPLYHQSLFYLGKITFWDWVEQHRPNMLKMAKDCFAVLLPYYPDHQLLQLYSGERLAYQEMTILDSLNAPPWAFYAGKALNQTLETIHYWVDNRQAENGEFGGKYDDDVEMLRWWPIARMAMEDQKTLIGLQRLVDGIWNSDWIIKGFSAKVRDVEHAAEPVADTQPMMIGLDYGNPIYIERCMESIKGLRDLWTGINDKGHRHFKSSWYSSTEIDTRPPRDCDVPLNARTVKAARWLAWYNKHPFAMKFLREWSDAWLEDCLRTDKGKPYGIVPPAIRYKDDEIGGHADNWHHPGLFWSYFDFHGGTQMLLQLLATYDLTGEERYLQPIELAMKLVGKYNGQSLKAAPMGSEEWVAGILKKSRSFAETMEKWWLLTGDDRFNELLKEYGSDYLKFRLSGDMKYVENGNRHVLEGIVNNGALTTTEGYFTDRIDIGDIHLNQIWGASHLESIYTGSSLYQGFYPFHAVTWTGFGDNYAAVVTKSTNHMLEILVFNMGDDLISGDLYFWRLDPGEYILEQGVDEDGDKIPESINLKRKFLVSGKLSSQKVEFSPGKTQVLRVRQLNPSPETKESSLADIAITRREIQVLRDKSKTGVKITIPVHNIGIVAARNIEIECKVRDGGEFLLITKKNIDLIEAPLDLEARIIEVDFFLDVSPDMTGEIIISANSDNRIKEITRINNQVVLKLRDFL